MICHCLDSETVVIILVILSAIGFGIGLYSLR